MRIQNPTSTLAPARLTPSAATPAEPKDVVDERKSTDKLSLPPGNRHHWDEGTAKWVRRLRDAAIPLMVRVDDKGFENIPKDGAYIVGPTHQSFLDALMASRIPGNKPFGSMADVNQFEGPLGSLLFNFGAFPVDRYGEFKGDFPKPVEHAAEILDSGRSFVFYPEGRIFSDKVVHPLKTGIGRIATESTAKYALPVAQHYSRDTQHRFLETAVGVALSGGAVAAGIWAACQGGATAAVAGLVTGAIGGAVVAGGAGFLAGPRGQAAVAGIGAAKWAAAGALATGIGAAAVGAMAPTLAPWVIGATSALTGAAGLGLAYHWTHRPVAHTHIGQPIPLEPYRLRAAASSDPKAKWNEALKITADFHKALVDLKTPLTGIESPFKMDEKGTWGKQPDGRWALVEQNKQHDWVPVQPVVYES